LRRKRKIGALRECLRQTFALEEKYADFEMFAPNLCAWWKNMRTLKCLRQTFAPDGKICGL
jgi:hypothetical protein